MLSLSKLALSLTPSHGNAAQIRYQRNLIDVALGLMNGAIIGQYDDADCWELEAQIAINIIQTREYWANLDEDGRYHSITILILFIERLIDIQMIYESNGQNIFMAALQNTELYHDLCDQFPTDLHQLVDLPVIGPTDSFVNELGECIGELAHIDRNILGDSNTARLIEVIIERMSISNRLKMYHQLSPEWRNIIFHQSLSAFVYQGKLKIDFSCYFTIFMVF